jgi:hypothetical protein
VRDEIAEHVERDDESKRAGRLGERAAVVAWLRRRTSTEGSVYALALAQRIEAGEHLK